MLLGRVGATPKTDLERLQPYCAEIARACEEYGVDPFLVAGLLLRETGCGWGAGYVVPAGKPRHLGWGDDPDGRGPRPPHAFGLGQFDIRYHASFVGSEQAQTPIGQFRKICSLLVEARRGFIHSASFAGKDRDQAWRCALAAYNASFGCVLRAYVLGGIDAVDSVTAGKNYSSDIIAKAARLRAMRPDLFAHRSATVDGVPALAGVGDLPHQT